MPNDSFGDRMKEYENAYRLYLPKRMPVIIRVDGRAFHTFTKGFQRPFDDVILDTMKDVAIELCRNVEGCKLAYTQSDEISLVLRNDDELTTQAWFGNNLQKLVSLTASIATSAFDKAYRVHISSYRLPTSLDFLSDDKQEQCIRTYNLYYGKVGKANFDSRAFVLPQSEVANYFIWRQVDAIRNSIESCSRSFYSNKELFKKNTSEMVQMMNKKGFDWNSLPMRKRGGLCIVKRYHDANGVTRSRWEPDYDIPIFSENRDYIINEVWGKNE